MTTEDDFEKWFKEYFHLHILTCDALKISSVDPLVKSMLRTTFYAGVLAGVNLNVHFENLQPPQST